MELVYGLGAGLALAVAVYFAGRAAKSSAEARLAQAEAELKALKSRSEKQEYRLERFDLVWFPTVSFSPSEKTVLNAAPGLPHCRKCLLPLSQDRGEWACRQCAARFPDSLADLAVTDQITKQALQWFLERHPGYRVPR